MNADTMEKSSSFPVLDLDAAQALQDRRLQEESEAREKKLVTDLEVKYAMFHRQLEESFADKEKKLIDELLARHAAECYKLDEAGRQREQALLGQLHVARRQLLVVVLGAVVSIALILNFKVRPYDAAVPALPLPVNSGEVALPPQDLPTPVAVVPAAAPAASVTAVKTGNGGNFAGGKSSAK